MEYIRESRRPPGRLKGWVCGGGAPLSKQNIYLFLGLLTKAEDMTQSRYKTLDMDNIHQALTTHQILTRLLL